MKNFNRREFVKAAAVIGAGAALTPSMIGEAFASGEDGPLVIRAKGTDPARLARESVNALGGMSAFVKKGSLVVVKPNIGWDRAPEYAANTNPELVKEVVLMCLEAGAAKVMLFDRTCNDPRRCYVNSGIKPAIDEIDDKRVELTHIDERRFVKKPIDGGKVLTSWSFYEDVLDADAVINMPVAKHHSAARLTLGMKNVMGVIGGNRSVLHKQIHQALVDLNRVVKPRLVVLDATRILVANGPQGGSLDDVRNTDTVIAGTDVVAVDSVACGLFGIGPDDVDYIRLGHEQGLGIADPAGIRLRELEVQA